MASGQNLVRGCLTPSSVDSIYPVPEKSAQCFWMQLSFAYSWKLPTYSGVNMQGSAERSGPVNRFIFSPLSWVCWAFRPAFSRPAAQTVHPNAPGLLCTPPLDKHREKGGAWPWPTDRQNPQDVVGLRLSHWRQFSTVGWREPCHIVWHDFLQHRGRLLSDIEWQKISGKPLSWFVVYCLLFLLNVQRWVEPKRSFLMFQMGVPDRLIDEKTVSKRVPKECPGIVPR